MRRARAGAQAAFTLIEMFITVSTLGVFAMMTVGASESNSSLTEMGNIKGEMLRQSQRAIGRILQDLRLSGFVSLGGKDYPHLYDSGAAGIGFEAYEYVPGNMSASPSDADFGIMRSIVICLPSDLDGDGRPELDADGNGVPELDGNRDGTPTDSAEDVADMWDPNEVIIHPTTRLSWNRQDVGYIVTPTGPNGENELVRVTAGAAGEREVLARGVERIQFDTAETASYSIPGGTVRVRLFFRVRASDGKVYRSQYEVIARPKNG